LIPPDPLWIQALRGDDIYLYLAAHFYNDAVQADGGDYLVLQVLMPKGE
jgi:hypothetical protein